MPIQSVKHYGDPKTPKPRQNEFSIILLINSKMKKKVENIKIISAKTNRNNILNNSSRSNAASNYSENSFTNRAFND